jgi:hypothetical protein
MYVISGVYSADSEQRSLASSSEHNKDKLLLSYYTHYEVYACGEYCAL